MNLTNRGSRVIHGFQNVEVPIPHAVVTLGNFDGVHLGHQEIIKLALSEARARKGECVAYTFRPHPQVALKAGGLQTALKSSGTTVPLLTTYDEKLELLTQAGVDWIVEEPFTLQFSNVEPQTFFSKVLLGRLHAEVIVVGFDFVFGHERHGNLELLKNFCQQAGVRLFIVEPYRIEGEVVSSSKIRQHLLEGQIELANRLLGRPFSYQGIVIHGQGRGRQLGVPTANLKLENKLVLPYGVYATWAVWNGKKFPSVTNVGVRPTFESERENKFQNGSAEPLPALVETHLLDTTLDLYDSPLCVEFYSRLRDEKKFPNLNELVKQIQLDISQARRCLIDKSN